MWPTVQIPEIFTSHWEEPQTLFVCSAWDTWRQHRVCLSLMCDSWRKRPAAVWMNEMEICYFSWGKLRWTLWSVESAVCCTQSCYVRDNGSITLTHTHTHTHTHWAELPALHSHRFHPMETAILELIIHFIIRPVWSTHSHIMDLSMKPDYCL